MNITVINPFAGLQNAYSPGEGKTANASNAPPVAVSGSNSGALFSGEIDALQGQSIGIIARVSSMEGQLDDVNAVVFPPFFPIATYQRIDLIMQVNGIREEISLSTLPPEVKAIAGDNLDKDATDAQLGDAISKLFAVRDTLTKGRDVAAMNPANEPGSILALKA